MRALWLIGESLYYAVLFLLAAALATACAFVLIWAACGVVCCVLSMVIAVVVIVLCHDCCSWALTRLGIWYDEDE